MKVWQVYCLISEKGMRIKSLILCLMLLHKLQLSAAEVKTIFTWSYDNKLISMVYYFDQADYSYYKNTSRVYDDWVHYLKEDPGYAVMDDFANEFKLLASEHRWSDWQLAECAISFVQTLKYKNDGQWEYPRYPIETLVEKGGDCEDLAILLDKLLDALGFDCVLISPLKHMGVGIATKYPVDGAAFEHRGKNYYYIETTSGGWAIGDYPEHLSAEASIYDDGDVDAGVLLSAYTYSFKNYTIPVEDVAEATQAEEQDTEETETAEATADKPTTNTPVYNPNAPKRPANTYTIDVDKVVIDGKKETVVTKVVDDGSSTKIVADSE